MHGVNYTIVKTHLVGGFLRGGEGEIRTPDTDEGMLAFQASALDHYATSPSGFLLWRDHIQKSP